MPLWSMILPVKNKDELLVINILAILLIPIITFLPSNVLHIILGLPAMLFFPGYTLLSALFPKKDTFKTIDRVALSIGMSFVVVSLIGLILNLTALGVRVYPVLIATILFIIAASVTASFKRYKLSPEERFGVSFGSNLTKWRGTSVLNKVLYIVLILAISSSIGAVSYAVTTSDVGEEFTQFYILDLEGKSEHYPKEVAVGEEVRVIVGIVNQERMDMSYRLEVPADGITYKKIEPVALAYKEKWEREIIFTLTEAGKGQEVLFLLYKYGEGEPYLWLRLSIDVRE